MIPLFFHVFVICHDKLQVWEWRIRDWDFIMGGEFSGCIRVVIVFFGNDVHQTPALLTQVKIRDLMVCHFTQCFMWPFKLVVYNSGVDQWREVAQVVPLLRLQRREWHGDMQILLEHLNPHLLHMGVGLLQADHIHFRSGWLNYFLLLFNGVQVRNGLRI